MADLGATISAASGLVGSASQITDSASATGVSGILGTVASLASGVKLPLPNVLSNYATYDYILSLSVLTFDQQNNPDSTYMKGVPTILICKTGGIDSNNRVQTSYGKFDFFIDNLQIDSIIGMTNQRGSQTTTLTFSVTEPYSLGVFMLALQTAAYQCGWKNWRHAPFLLKVEFRGNKEDGSIQNIPSATRYIPIHLTTVTIKATEKGTIYDFGAYTTSGKAYASEYAEIRTDVAIKGKTVQEVLQTGEQSLQAVVNKKLRKYVTDKVVAVADEILILFPTDLSSGGNAAASAANVETKSTATVNPSSSSTASLYKKLGVVEGTNKTAVQDEKDCNALGKVSMGYDLSKLGDQVGKKESAVMKNGIWHRGDLQVDPKDGSLRFAQGADIPTIIDQVLTQSEYPKTALASANLDQTTGMRKWWRIDPQVYYIKSDENLKLTNTYPRLIVYRVVPYDTHISRLPVPNEKPVGIEYAKKTVVKEYNYLYTGKNTEVVKFDIDFSIQFANTLAADLGDRTQDGQRANQTNSTAEKQALLKPMAAGSDPSNQAGAMGTPGIKYDGTELPGDIVGGGGKESSITRAARMWSKAIKNPNEQMILNMEINGDPYWLVQSGLGNYTASPVKGVADLNKDGTVNYQNGEVNIKVNFRSPLDINQTTGLYTFGGLNKNAPVIGWDGLYCVNRVSNTFKNGLFRQTLEGFRRPGQENKKEGTAKSGLNIDTPAEPRKDPAAASGGSNSNQG